MWRYTLEHGIGYFNQTLTKPPDLKKWEEEVTKRSGHYQIKRLDQPFALHISRSSNADAKRLLVIAGLHGEECTLDVIPRILEKFQTPDINLDIFGPANPYGVQTGSRYNKNGVDINLDFGEDPRSLEAKRVKELILEINPTIISALHESPKKKDCFMNTNLTFSKHYRETGGKIIASLKNQSVPLASRGILFRKLNPSGWNSFGIQSIVTRSWTTTLGAYADHLNIPMVNFETPGRNPDFDKRTEYQLIFVSSLVESF